MSEALRVVIDTNVFVAAAFDPRSNAARVLAEVREGRLVLVWDAATRRETEHVLRRIPRLDPADASALFSRGEEWTGSRAADVSAIADPDDRKFAALAAGSGAVLVSSDQHLLGVRDILPATVETPAELLRRSRAYR